MDLTKLYVFLSGLAKNNNREWFAEQKPVYDILNQDLILDIQILIMHMSEFDKSLSELNAKDCFFRIYRDIRFSYDKTPYKTHIGIWITKGGRKGNGAGYYIHLEAGNSFLSAGVWQPGKNELKAIRKDIYENYEEFEEIIEQQTFKQTFGIIRGDSLKKMPAGFNPEFKDSYYIKLKDFIVDHKIGDDFFFNEKWIRDTLEVFKQSYPFVSYMNTVIDNM